MLWFGAGKSLFSFGHATKPQTKEESLQLLSSTLKFCSAPIRRARFGFWVDLLKSKVLVQLYPLAFPNGVPLPPIAVATDKPASGGATTPGAAASASGAAPPSKPADPSSPTAKSEAKTPTADSGSGSGSGGKSDGAAVPEDLRAYAFKPDCPHGAQVVVVDWLVSCLYDGELSLVVGGTQSNLDFMMEAFRQSKILLRSAIPPVGADF